MRIYKYSSSHYAKVLHNRRTHKQLIILKSKTNFAVNSSFHFFIYYLIVIYPSMSFLQIFNPFFKEMEDSWKKRCFLDKLGLDVDIAVWFSERNLGTPYVNAKIHFSSPVTIPLRKRSLSNPESNEVQINRRIFLLVSDNWGATRISCL